MNWNLPVWLKEDYDNLICFLKVNSDISYKNFSERIIKTQKQIIGIRVNVFEKIAKENSNHFCLFVEIIIMMK